MDGLDGIEFFRAHRFCSLELRIAGKEDSFTMLIFSSLCTTSKQLNGFLIISLAFLSISAEKTTFAYRLSMNRTRFLPWEGNSCSL